MSRDCFLLCSRFPKEGTKSAIDQLRRASQSVGLNIAEGSARYSKADKVNFMRIARGSVFECAAVLDLLEGLPLGVEAELPKIRERLVLMGKMLSGFIRYLETQEPKKRGN